MSSDLIPLSSIQASDPAGENNDGLNTISSHLLEALKATGLNPPLLVKEIRRQPHPTYELIYGLDIYKACIEVQLEDVIVEVCDDLSNDVVDQYKMADQAAFGTANPQSPRSESFHTNIDPITEAEAIQKSINERGIRASRMASELGIARSTLSNKLRLLRLCEPVREHLSMGRITAAQARMLVTLEPPQQINAVVAMLSNEPVSVRDAWQISRQSKAQAPELHVSRERRLSEVRRLAERITEQVGYPIRLRDQRQGGELSIRYFDYDGLEAILERLNVVLDD